MKHRTRKPKKEFVRVALVVDFWIMVGLGLLMILIPFMAEISMFAILWVSDVIAVFVISIMHLNKYPEKALAITALVLSSVLILSLIIGFFFFFTTPQYGEEIVLHDRTNVGVSGDMINTASFVLYSDGKINLNFSSDKFANLYLFKEDEYTRYMYGETSYYAEESLNVLTSNWNDVSLPAGEYKLVVEPVNESINYSFKLTFVPYD